MINELRTIGLSDLEARCYLTLYENPRISGYEVAKKVSVSRTNVYAALRALTDKGMCRMIETEPVLYEAVPIEQIITLVRADFNNTTQVLLEQLHTAPQTPPSFYSWQGDKAILTAIRRLAANAQKTIVVDVWSEDLQWVEQPLLEAESRGVAVTVIIIGEVQSKLKHVVTHKRSEEWTNLQSRKFSMLCDAKSALLGSLGKAIKPSLLETDHPALAELLLNAFYHDIVMERIEQDFEKELESKYGNHYEHILASYKEYF